MATHRPASPDRSETDESQGGPEGRFPARSGDSSGWHPPRRSQIGDRIRHDTLSVLIKLKATARQSSGESPQSRKCRSASTSPWLTKEKPPRGRCRRWGPSRANFTLAICASHPILVRCGSALVTAALLGRFLPGLGPLAIASGPFFYFNSVIQFPAQPHSPSRFYFSAIGLTPHHRTNTFCWGDAEKASPMIFPDCFHRKNVAGKGRSFPRCTRSACPHA
jgi:hypothetical protein